jgi:hypothetical protein
MDGSHNEWLRVGQPIQERIMKFYPLDSQPSTHNEYRGFFAESNLQESDADH